MLKLIILLLLVLEFKIIAEEDEKAESSSVQDRTTTEIGIIKPTKNGKALGQQDIASGDLFSKCYDDIGCINTDESWFHPQHRPVNLKPLERQTIKTEFILIRRNSTGENKRELFYEIMDSCQDCMKSSSYAPGKFLFVLIHDFTSNGYTGWIKHISRVLKDRTKECNIISVDWHAGAEPPFDQAAANARVVGLELIHMLKFLKEHQKLLLEQVHLIGHGLGAHIAGYVGYVLKTHKITGLDPSGPRFQGMPAHVRLDASHADYVEVLHTDANKQYNQGATEIFGHTDFFINNAERQPGCSRESYTELLSVTRAMVNQGEILTGCSHKRAYKYYIESLSMGGCTFLGIKCHSYVEFRQGKCTTCGHNCRTFGLVTYTEPNSGSYFLQTNSDKPYCLYQYRVNIHIKGNKENYFGSFEFILIDRNHYTTTSSMLEAREFRSGTENQFVIYAGEPEMGKIVDAKVGWKEKSKKFCLINCKQSIGVERVEIQSINSNTINAQEVALCPTDATAVIESGEYQEFFVCKN